MNFQDKVVLVTGGSSGIGAATAILFAKEGANVVIVGRNETKLNNVAAECAKVGKNPLIIKADVSKEDEARSVVKQTIKSYGKLDVLVNNAGIFRRDDILDNNFMETFDNVFNTNMRAVAIITNIAAPYLIETKGNIVNISSVAGTHVSVPNFTSYRVSKAALNHFTRCVALELASSGVRVNSVSPGPVVTDIFDAVGIPNIIDTLAKSTALNKVGDPEEVADLILFLASDKAKSVTGSEYVTDNGMLLK